MNKIEAGDDGCVFLKDQCGPGFRDPCWCCYSAVVQPPWHPEDICFQTHEECEAWPCPADPPTPPLANSTRTP